MVHMYETLLHTLCNDAASWSKGVGELLPTPSPALPVAPSRALDKRLLHELFLEQSHRAPGAPAVVSVGEEVRTLTYGEMEARTRVVAACVESCVKKSEDAPVPVVAVITSKSWEQVVGLLGILRAKCAYLPINAQQLPQQRVETILRLSDAAAVVVDAQTVEERGWLRAVGLPLVDAGADATSPDGALVYFPAEGEGRVSEGSRSKMLEREGCDLAYLIYTSGSTGVPKGVCCHHQGAVNTLLDLNERFGVSSDDRVLALSSVSFDLSVYDVFGLLGAGASLVVPPHDAVSPPDPERWLELVREQGVTLWNTVPAFVELLVAHAEHARARLPASLRLIFMSGDWIPRSLPARLRALSDCADLRIVSMGGATEAAIWSNMFELPAAELDVSWKSIPYGRPLRNQTMLVLNEELEHCEPWVTGVIYIGGAGVALGYYGDERQTSKQFVQHAGEWLFRTGDLGRLRPDGNLEILGREDSQVKVNGFRVELGEIEHAMERLPLVFQACACVVQPGGGPPALAGFIVPSPTAHATADVLAGLRAHLQATLPANLVPPTISIVDKIPLNRNGKVDRDALAKAALSTGTISKACAAPEAALTGVHRWLRDTWASVFSVEPSSIGLDDNFFQIGGSSLHAMHIVSTAQRSGLPLTIRQIFGKPTIRQLAAELPDMNAMHGLARKAADEELLFEVRHDHDNLYTPFPLIGITRAYYVGLYLSEFTKGMKPQIYFEWEWKGRCDVQRLQTALNKFIACHPAWRSVVTSDGMMRILEHVPSYHVDVETPHTRATTEHMRSTRKEMSEGGPWPENWPLFECRVTHTSEKQSLVHLVVSLFIMDGISDLTLRRQLSALYEKPNMTLPSVQLLYKDYCMSLTGMNGSLGLAASQKYQSARDYWWQRVPTLPPAPELPVLVAQEGQMPTGRFEHLGAVLDAEMFTRLKTVCGSFGVSPTSLMLSIYSMVLARFARNKHFMLNILHCLRHPVHDDVPSVIGNFSSSFLLSADLQTPQSVLAHVQGTATELSVSLEHAVISGVEVMEQYNKVHGKVGTAVAPFVFVSAMGLEHALPDWRDLAFKETHVQEQTPGSYVVNAVKEYPDGRLMWLLEVMEGLFPLEVSRGMVHMYETLLHTLCNDAASWSKGVGELLPTPSPALPVAPSRALDKRLLHELFLEQSHRAPGAPAVVSVGEEVRTLTYGEMEARTRVVAACVESCVKKSEDAPVPVVAVITSKSWEQVVGLLGILRAKCAYLPINAQQLPQQRVETILRLSDAAAVVVDAQTVEERGWLRAVGLPLVDAGADATSPDGALVYFPAEGEGRVSEGSRSKMLEREGCDLAYLIYTSGSTGVPKGVCCHHQGAVNTLLDLNERFGVSSDDRVLALSSVSFDLSVYDVFGLLGAGASLVVPPHDAVSPPDPERWLELVREQGVTLWNTVPAFVELLVAHAEHARARLPASLRLIFMSGDWIPRSLPARLRALSDCADLRIVSMGGATEAAIWSNMFELPAAELDVSWKSIPYGRPLRNQTMLVLNEELEHCEPWVTGVIYIGGAGVALGYYGDERQTSKQFVQHAGEWLFRTGDLGRLRPDGNLEILGREDSQVKVNGFRVELGEIEEVIVMEPGVTAAAATPFDGNLAAYVVVDPAMGIDEDVLLPRLRARCSESLPSYMMPKHWMTVNNIPLSANGKVQRDRLPRPNDSSLFSGLAGEVVPPASELEHQVRAAIASILRVPAETLCCQTGNFFELGGDSVAALRLLATLRSSLGVKLSVQQLFGNPTVHGLCEELLPSTSTAPLTTPKPQLQLITLQPGQPGHVPLVLVHPAGASSLCYLPLARSLGAQQPVYAFDDHFLSGECSFSFSSIEDVAAECLSILHHELGKSLAGDVVFGGWSYGGVVALQLAKAVQKQGGPFSPRAVVLIDAPLGQTSGRGFFRGGESSSSLIATLRAQLEPVVADSNVMESLTSNAAQHFVECNRLLDVHAPTTGMNCQLVDIRPANSECRFYNSLDRLTAGDVHEFEVLGDHWTMLFGENTAGVVSAIAQFL